MKIVLIGAGGYGQVYLNTIINELKIAGNLAAVVDPFAKNSRYYNYLTENKIPIFNALEDFYKTNSADLAIVSSPIHFHEEQTITALNNGSHVLCEKPVTATVKQARNMRACAEKNGLKLAVGFQWSFSDRMRALKRDILDGKFGRPVCLKSSLYWPRPDSYYETGDWKGRRISADGRPINDSVVSNATAHYLHNIFFLLGDSMDSSAAPVNFSGSLFRLRDIESFDTCLIRGNFDGGARFYYAATHSCETGGETSVFEYEFEKCVVTIEREMEIAVKWKNGETENYGGVPENGLVGKVEFMIGAIEKNAPVRCPIDAALPHLAVTNALFDRFPVQNFQSDVLYKTESPAGVGVRGLRDAMNHCFEKELLANETELFPFNNAVVTAINNFVI